VVPDVRLGWAYTAVFNLTDENGSPFSSAPIPDALIWVYGPDSATALVSGPSTVYYFGNGDYGVAVPGTALLTAGTYYYHIRSITIDGVTFTNLEASFTVGVVPPEYRTLRAIVVATAEALGIGVFGTSTGVGSTTTLIDTRWLDAGLAVNEFVGDELLILEPGAVADSNPVRVTASDPALGRLTFAPAVTAVASGTDYLLIRTGQGGLRYAQILEAIVAAVADLATRERLTDRVTLTTTAFAREYALPGAMLEVSGVEFAYQPTSLGRTWHAVMPSLWQVNPDRRTIEFHFQPGAMYDVRLTGRVGVPEPRRLARLVKVPWTTVRDLAVGALSLKGEQRAGLAYRRGTAATVTRGGW